MARQKLTAGRVREFKCPVDKTQDFLWDSEVPGLGVRATMGAKVFVFQGRFDGKTIRAKIGDVRTWPIDSIDPNHPGARQEARRLQGLIDQGIDPRIDKKERLAEQEAKREESHRGEVTLGEVWPIYLEARRNRWGDRYYLDHIRVAQQGGEKKKRGKGKTKPGPLSTLMHLKLNALTSDQVSKWAAEESVKRPTQTRIAFECLRGFINWCNDQPDYRGLAATDACSPRIKRQTLPRKKAKDDCLQKEQLSAWFEAVRGLYNPVISAYLQALLLTGARREELSCLKWEDADFKWSSITIHDKVEGLRTIPLTPYVSSLLASLPRRNAYVFSSPTAASGRLVEPRIPHNKALVVAGIEGLTIHGLRRSFGTLAEWVEVPAGVVAQIMGHKPSATAEKHYRRRPLDLLRQWHFKIEAWILSEAGIEQPEHSEKGLRVVKSAQGE
ncbi:MAG: integrase family protein [Desulfobacteraceae bacterium]|nr:integrase family protein [Desulfobacteraceae bacterium]